MERTAFWDNEARVGRLGRWLTFAPGAVLILTTLCLFARVVTRISTPAFDPLFWGIFFGGIALMCSFFGVFLRFDKRLKVLRVRRGAKLLEAWHADPAKVRDVIALVSPGFTVAEGAIIEELFKNAGNRGVLDVLPDWATSIANLYGVKPHHIQGAWMHLLQEGMLRKESRRGIRLVATRLLYDRLFEAAESQEKKK
jgi:hypothetical protein